MWEKIRSMFGSDDTAGNHDAPEPRLAATALLVEAALADGIYADVEEDMICAALADAFELDEQQCRDLIEEAEQLVERSVDHYIFTAQVKRLPARQRQRLVRALWRVVFADGEESPFEDAFVRRIVPLLAVSDRDSRFARQDARAEAGVAD